jgi:hypothetical protein
VLIQLLALCQHVVHLCEVVVTVPLDAGQDVAGSSVALVAAHAAGARYDRGGQNHASQRRNNGSDQHKRMLAAAGHHPRLFSSAAFEDIVCDRRWLRASLLAASARCRGVTGGGLEATCRRECVGVDGLMGQMVEAYAPARLKCLRSSSCRASRHHGPGARRRRL